MSEFTPTDFPYHDYREPVCTKCFSDDDIAEFTENFDESLVKYLTDQISCHAKRRTSMNNIVVYAAKPETKIRKMPRNSSRVVNHILMGTWLKVVKKDKGFLKVQTRKTGPGGWVSKDDIRLAPILKVFYVDVGQGDGAIIEHPEGIMLIDGGPNKNMHRFMLHRYGPILNERRTIHIGAIIMSHPDTDHFAGLTHVLNDENFTIGTIFHNGIIRFNGKHQNIGFDLGSLKKRTINGNTVKVLTETVDTLAEVKALLRKKPSGSLMQKYLKFWNAAVKAHSAGRLKRAKRITSLDGEIPGFSGVSDEGLRVEVLGPVPTKTSRRVEYLGFAKPEERNKTSRSSSVSSSHTRNGHSIVLKLLFGKHSFLFGGDLNIPAERHLIEHYGKTNPFQCNVAKACHHGSSDFSVKYLQKVRPHVNVFSSGDNKSFDHPMADALGAAGRHTQGAMPLLFSTELARATSKSGIHYGLINARSDGTILTMAQMKEQHNGSDVWDSFTVPWKGKFKRSC